MQSKFDSDRAGEYAVQSRIALAGYTPVTNSRPAPA